MLFDYIHDRNNEDLEPLDFFSDSDDDDEDEDAGQKSKTKDKLVDDLKNGLFSVIKDKHLRASLL